MHCPSRVAPISYLEPLPRSWSHFDNRGSLPAGDRPPPSYGKQLRGTPTSDRKRRPGPSGDNE